MAEVEAADVTSLATGDVATTVALVTQMARAYTRGRGFDDDEPNDDIAAVITTASARLAANGGQTSSSQAVGPFVQDMRSYFNGWTIAEQIVLNRYRVRAQ